MDKAIEDFKLKQVGNIRENVSFKNLTTFKTGGIARYVISPLSIENLKYIIETLKKENIPFKIFGNGSNILASDKDYNGIIIKLNLFNKMAINENIIEVEAGYNMMQLANDFSKLGYSGLEWACGIPGTVGGAIYMNAGAYLMAISDILLEVTILAENLNIEVLSVNDLKYSYRHSIFMEKNWIILKAKLKLEVKDVQEIRQVITDRMQRRLESQPLEFPSAGSAFRNPEGNYAGRLIEDCNLKGMMIGGAQISDKHANFIINRENATSSDIKELMELAKEEVYQKYKISLKVEQELFNWE